MSERILTCVYCGHEYPQDTPAHGNQVLTEHIKVCEAHPLRKAEADIAVLRSALVGLIGVDTKQELRQMEGIFDLIPSPMRTRRHQSTRFTLCLPPPRKANPPPSQKKQRRGSDREPRFT